MLCSPALVKTAVASLLTHWTIGAIRALHLVLSDKQGAFPSNHPKSFTLKRGLLPWWQKLAETKQNVFCCPPFRLCKKNWRTATSTSTMSVGHQGAPLFRRSPAHNSSPPSPHHTSRSSLLTTNPPLFPPPATRRGQDLIDSRVPPKPLRLESLYTNEDLGRPAQGSK